MVRCTVTIITTVEGEAKQSLQSPYHYGQPDNVSTPSVTTVTIITTVTISLQSPYTLLQCQSPYTHFVLTLDGMLSPQLTHLVQDTHFHNLFFPSTSSSSFSGLRTESCPNRQVWWNQSWQQQHWVHCEERMRMYVHVYVWWVTEWLYCMYEWLTKWVYEWVSVWVCESPSEWVYEWVYESLVTMSECVVSGLWVCVWLSEWVYMRVCMSEWVCVCEWLDQCVHSHYQVVRRLSK